MKKWLKSFYRWLGNKGPEPHPTSGVTSVLFVLNTAKHGLTFQEIRDTTNIVPADLARLLEALEWPLDGRPRITSKKVGGSLTKRRVKVYSIVHKAQTGA